MSHFYLIIDVAFLLISDRLNTACIYDILIYDISMRTLVDLPDQQIEDLARICETEQISRAEAIRRAIANFVRHKMKAHFKHSQDKAFGLWKSRKVDALEYEDKIRTEWK
jgi:hypothetical protein